MRGLKWVVDEPVEVLSDELPTLTQLLRRLGGKVIVHEKRITYILNMPSATLYMVIEPDLSRSIMTKAWDFIYNSDVRPLKVRVVKALACIRLGKEITDAQQEVIQLMDMLGRTAREIDCH